MSTLELFVLIVIILIGSFVIYLMFAWLKHDNLRVRDPMNLNSKYINDYWVYTKIDKVSKVREWVNYPLIERPIRLPYPPEDALSVGKKGKLFAEVYKISENEYIYIKDKGVNIVDAVEEDAQGKKRNIKVVEDVASGDVISKFKPLSTTQREVIVQQTIKASERSKGRWTPEKIIMFGAIGIVGLLVALIIIYWGELAQPLLNMQNTNLATAQAFNDITLNQARIMQSLGYEINVTQPAQVFQQKITQPVDAKGEGVTDRIRGFIE